MKNTLLLAFIFCSHLVNGQNQQIINRMMESQTIEDIKFVADNIVSTSNEKYNFYKIVSRVSASKDIYKLIFYTKEGMTDIDKAELSSNSCNDCIVVKFQELNKNENIDLQIKGNVVYYFKDVSGKFIDLADFWRATFYPDISKDRISTDYKFQEYRINKDLKYKFRKNEEIWTISKSY